ncbi:MAG: DCL family protein [Chlorobiaceae bacterium]|nr:DCL family protein [Chlorobiaceae bacterium]
MTYLIANESFPTKDCITARCRAILAATPDGQPIDERYAPFLFELFQFHDEWPQKADGGVINISTQSTPHGTRCFILVKLGSNSIDISFPHAIRQIPSSRSAMLLPQALRDFRNAARVAVKEQIYSFRDTALQQEQRCPFTGEVLSRSTCAVDHIPPKTFEQLLYDFCRGRSLNPLHVAVGSEGGTVAVFEDAELLAAWQVYHSENAHLRLLSKIGNLQLPKVPVPWSKLWI